ncbi:hypothetical protein MBLNU457_1307t1 [Dothideomycetes sp. NU457]
MLVRAAARRQRRHISRQLSEDFQQLHLPFLCPAQLRWNATQAVQPTPGPRRVSQSPKPDRKQSRTLASVAGSAPYETPSLNHDPYQLDGQQQSYNWGDWVKGPHKPIMISYDRSNTKPPTAFKYGIGGTLQDLMQNLYTCLRVSRYARAEQIIERMTNQDDITASELAHAHEAYLSFSVDDIRQGAGAQKNWQRITSWFRRKIVDKQVSVGPAAYIAMMRGAMAALQNESRDMTVRHYADISSMPLSEICDDKASYFENQEYMLVNAILGRKTVDEIEALQRRDDESQAELRTKELYISEDDIPKVLEVTQKGAGLKALKQGLESVATSPSPPDNEISGEEVDNTESAHMRAMARERMIEDAAAAAAVDRWKVEDEQLRSLGLGGPLHSKPVGALMWSWYSALLPVLKEELLAVKKALGNSVLAGHLNEERKAYGAYLELLPPETLAATTIINVMNMMTRGKDRETGRWGGAFKLTAATNMIGKALMAESAAQATKEGAKRNLMKGRQDKGQASKRRHPFSHNQLEWPLQIRVKVGALMLSKLIETAKMPITRTHPRTKESVSQLQPAFMHKNVFILGRRLGYISPCQDLVEKLHREPLGGVICKRLPMVVKPAPWTGFKEGGYLNYPTDFIRFPPTDQTPKDYAQAAIEKGDMRQVFDAMNVLSSIPWKINENVLKVQIEAWNTGEKVGNLAPLNPKFDLPPEPPHTASANVRRQWQNVVQDLENKRTGMHSQRCFQNFQLEIARAFRKEIIYFPHNIDFRGRAYPIPPYLNHMGADNVRGLMLFATGKELGSQGLRWLKIHLANVFGYDKASLQERENFVMEHIDDIYDSANNPLTGRRWWLQSEDAFQTLAACTELKDALQSPDPEKFVSHLPIHQDGTCNGLQHYAALGGDEVGARQVNLVPGDRPADVYSAVMDAVKASVEEDYNNDHPVAKVLHGRITRKVVKQPVMTNVYGVTYYGAKQQVKKQIEELFPEIVRSQEVNHTTLSAYVAKKIFQSLGEMFRGAQAIQDWLGVCADRISTSVSPEQLEALGKPAPPKKKDARLTAAANAPTSQSREQQAKGLFKSSVIWTTPLRLPVVQPYRASSSREVSTVMQSLSIQEPRNWDPISKRRQLQGFPPNFIHSLDATHMMLSALKSHEKGMTFASIHDSFWTHACDIDNLSELLRDAFVHMHSEDVVGRLREEMLARYGGSFYLATIDESTPVGMKLKAKHAAIVEARKDYKDMIGSHKITTTEAELLIERERIRLLESTDPEERNRGESMLTPGSIFAEEADDSSITVPTELTEGRLGRLPDDAALAKNEDEEAMKNAMPVLEESNDVDAEANDDAEIDNEKNDINDEREAIEEEEELEKMVKPKKAKRSRKQYVWLPFNIPNVPQKGSFDVTTLKQSRYFFH